MAEHCLHEYLVESDARLRVLVLEYPEYLPLLRRKMKNAELICVTSDEYAPRDERFSRLDVRFVVMDYEAQRLPFDDGYFDVIVAERYLEMLVNPRDITAGLAHLLKPTGFLLTSFLNIRCWNIINDLKSGHFFPFVARPLAKSEAVRVLGVSGYKDVLFRAKKLPAPKGTIEALEQEGYENFEGDLETELWLVKAGRADAQTEALKSIYTEATRKELARLIRRIEFSVDERQAKILLRELIEREGIFDDYLRDFACSISTKSDALLKKLELD